MLKKRKIVWLIFGLVVISAGILAGPKINNYLEFRKVAKAVGAMPWQDGGVITNYIPACVLDTPIPGPTTCAVSCPLVTTLVGPACVGYTEMDVTGQYGTFVIAVPLGFVFVGGGVTPRPGAQFIAGGASPSVPWVIGISP